MYIHPMITRVSTEVTFGRGDLSVCPPLGGLTRVQESTISDWEGGPPEFPTGTHTKGTSS